MNRSTPVVLMAHRAYLRALSRRNRRAWAEQRARLKPRVEIGRSYLPPSVTRQFTYVDPQVV